MAGPRATRTTLPRTALRAGYERVRSLGADEQVRECVDQLQNPSVLAADLAEACALIESCSGPPEIEADFGDGDWEEDEELVLEHFYPGRDVFLHGDEPARFTCCASALDPLGRLRPEQTPPADVEDGVDYLGERRDIDARLVLGVVQSDREATPYVLLLRALACLSELAPASQVEWLDQTIFKGALGEAPTFDLHLVLWERSAEENDNTADRSVFQLTRDLAELAKRSIAELPELRSLLGDIVCLRMNPDDFDGDLCPEWTV